MPRNEPNRVKQHPSDATLEHLSNLGVKYVQCPQKKGSVDEKLQEYIQEFLADNGGRSDELVVVISGDRDFAPQLRQIRAAKVKVMLLHAGGLSPGVKENASYESDRWRAIVDANTGGSGQAQVSPAAVTGENREMREPRFQHCQKFPCSLPGALYAREIILPKMQKFNDDEEGQCVEMEAFVVLRRAQGQGQTGGEVVFSAKDKK